jgi:hypothetical protein
MNDSEYLHTLEMLSKVVDKQEEQREAKVLLLQFYDVKLLDSPLAMPSDLPEHASLCEVVGILVKENAEAYFLAAQQLDNGQCKWVHIVPKRNVLNKRVLMFKEVD